MFSPEYGQLIDKEKTISGLQMQRDQFIHMLQEISSEILPDEKLGVALTPQSIKAAVDRIRSEQVGLRKKREELLNRVRRDAMNDAAAREGMTPDMLESFADESVRLDERRDELTSAVRKTRERQKEVEKYRSLLEEERARIERAQEAGAVLADLKVTHCPACDQEIRRQNASTDCYVCRQPLNNTSGAATSHKRLEFELAQLKGETEETDELLQELRREMARLDEEESKMEGRQEQIDHVLRSARSAAAAMLPPDLGAIDMNFGALQERIRQIERIRQVFAKREELSAQIHTLQDDVATLGEVVSRRTVGVRYETLGDWLSDGMNTYLNRISELNPRSWTQPPVSVHLSDRDFRIKVGNANWRVKLGGTLTLYFFLAYHYSLLELTTEANCRYPGALYRRFSG